MFTFNIQLFGEDWYTCKCCGEPMSDYRNRIYHCEKCGATVGDCCIDDESLLNSEGELLESECPVCSRDTIEISRSEYSRLLDIEEKYNKIITGSTGVK